MGRLDILKNLLDLELHLHKSPNALHRNWASEQGYSTVDNLVRSVV